MKQLSILNPNNRPIPVIMVWALGILLPTACVIWFMTEAMNNERLAVKQKLIEAYRPQLVSVQQQLQAHWREQFDQLNDYQIQNSMRTFSELVHSGKVSSAVLFDEARIRVYPSSPKPRSASLFPDTWARAQQSEFQESNPIDSAGLYADIAAQSDDAGIAAMALQAQARSLIKADDRNLAIQIFSEILAQDRFEKALDLQGRLVQPDALIRALQLDQNNTLKETENQLVELLNNYQNSQILSGQRQFLTERLLMLKPESGPFPLHRAEVMAANYLASDQKLSSDNGIQRLQSTADEKVWLFISSNEQIHALFTTDFIYQSLNNLIEENGFQPGLRIELLAQNIVPQDGALIDIPMSDSLAGWRLALYLEDDNILSSTASNQIAAYLWTGILIIAAIFILASVIAHYLAKQSRINQAKNDLIATVSHELKTPLSSIRVLVDTLLDDTKITDRNSQEYLELISRENSRLSQLIDNFLTFSRMERNKQPYQFVPTAPADVIQGALDSKQALLEAEGFDLTVEAPDDLPFISVDRQLFVTVLINLLDNASKYSGDNKQILIRTYQNAEHICFEVRDSGIGISLRHRKRIFERFYRIDQSLNQATEGCGLGLSIVEFIVRAHNGDIQVEGTPGKGSTFVVRLPIENSDLEITLEDAA